MPALLRDEVLRVSCLPIVSVLAHLSLGTVACIGDNPTGPFPEHRWDTKPAKGPTIQLERATTVGREYYPIGNSTQGGQGEPVSGVFCLNRNSTPAYQLRAHLSLYVNGEQIAIPAGVGVVDPVMTDGYVNRGATKCLYELHTLDGTGTLHVGPNVWYGQGITLGQFFALWGMDLVGDNTAGHRGPLTIYVDQERFDGDPRSIVLDENTLISLQVGAPLVPPPRFLLPVIP